MSKKEEGGVDGLKSKLYSRAQKPDMQDVRVDLQPNAPEAPVAWEDSGEAAERVETSMPMGVYNAAPRGGGFAKKFFLGSVVFFVLAAGAAAYFFFGGANFISPQNIDLQIEAPSLIDGGAQAQLQFIITNRNASNLVLADLVIDYPEGTRDPKDPTKGLPHERQSIGTINAGQQLKRTATAMFFGEEGSVQTIHATLEYEIANSNAVFTKQSDITITIGSSPVSVSVTPPTTAVAGEPFQITTTVRSNATTPLNNVIVQAVYPFGFKVTTATPKSEAGGTFWRLGTMAPGSTQVIKVEGTIDGQDGDQRVFRFLAGSDPDMTNTKVKTPFLSVPATVTVQRPFITGSISVDDKSGSTIAVPAGKQIQGSVKWQNNLSEPLSNVELVLTLKGPVLDTSSVQAGTGFYQSANNTITWTSAQDGTLAQVSPGAVGDMQFSFATLPPGTGTLYQNPTIDLSLTVRGVRAGDAGQESVSSVATTQVTLSSALALSATASYASGVRPPRAENQTNYNISWSVKNSSNIIGNAVVSTVLPPYVTYVSGGSGITYDQGSRTVTWQMGDIKAGVGYSGSPAVAGTFQVMLNPSTSQVNFAPQLTGAALLNGTDRFAQVQVSASADAPTTVDIVQSK